ncbi:MAG: beta-ketoacyl-ACP synthase [Nevskiaceae bacterium]|nr:MAG: beta-ketoacyl-ACP synthase [Nevskiaceae bacterium]
MHRVVVTGMAGISSLGDSWEQIAENLRAGTSGIRRMEAWDRYPELNTRLGGPISGFAPPAHYTRKVTRTMGRVALLASCATEQALADAGLKDDPIIQDGRMGISYGSCSGSTDALKDFASMLIAGGSGNLNATTYLRMMSHTAAVNIGIRFGIKGRVIPTTSACTSGSQGVGYAYEAIRFGRQKLMVAGGAEELCPTQAAVFDTLFATSTRNEAPSTTPSPFDAGRDGLVLGEGACTLILEEREHALARGARIYAEILGYGANSDGDHATHPNTRTMEVAMRLALDDAGLPPEAIGYINAHGTATEQGDIAESQATWRLFGNRPPVSSLKGNFGHTLGACGALESWLSIEMMRHDWFAPTLNLRNVDPRCGELDYLVGDGRSLQCDTVMNNNFAFGGINTSLIFRRCN